MECDVIAEDHNLRSEYIRNIVQTDAPTNMLSVGSSIPKIIIQYWHDEENIPEDVKECMQSWDFLKSKGFSRVLFTDKKANEFISKNFEAKYLEAFSRCHHPAMRCDYFRLSYLYIKGGFYVDADEVYKEQDCSYLFKDDKLKIQPLCYDKKTDLMVDPKKFIDDREFSEDWIFYVNNNPLIAPAGHPLLVLAHERATKLLLNSSSRLDIQSTTGPGNLSACLVHHSCELKKQNKEHDFQILSDWESVAYSKWPLSYRNDDRNWRLWRN